MSSLERKNDSVVIIIIVVVVVVVAGLFCILFSDVIDFGKSIPIVSYSTGMRFFWGKKTNTAVMHCQPIRKQL